MRFEWEPEDPADVPPVTDRLAKLLEAAPVDQEEQPPVDVVWPDVSDEGYAAH